MKIGFLGLGNMGMPMAKRLMKAGHSLTVWNRTAKAAEPLVSAGAAQKASAAEAVRGQEIVFSMLFDDAAHEQVLLGEDGAIVAMDTGTLHIACSTISVGLAELLTEEHARRHLQYVAAPVFGRPNVAVDGRLWIVVAGADAAVAKARPVLEPLGRGITVIGETPAQANALKIAGNFGISMMIQALSEITVFGKAYDMDPALLLETINNALFQSPFYTAYSKVLLDPPTKPGATVRLGLKDLKLFLDAADVKGVHLTIAERMEGRFNEIIAAGNGEADWASGMLRGAETASRK
ncbi:NAD(P)-dependent oxidoreductase [Acidicapsa dinghuensis]|uniref:NAD(P)-dependent oxidoreductase n=1 Tax=Acidicapsa dinghuensis TaxID=2218256 RepID=A0ABW1ECC8_9BACT|nr:NAD(P)-dependent oxidoreductase [Acidicapsa dinghuensis]